MIILDITLGIAVWYWLLRPSQFGRDIAKTVKSFHVNMGNLKKKDLEK